MRRLLRRQQTRRPFALDNADHNAGVALRVNAQTRERRLLFRRSGIRIQRHVRNQQTDCPALAGHKGLVS